MYNEASLQQVHTQQGKLPKTIVSYIRLTKITEHSMIHINKTQ